MSAITDLKNTLNNQILAGVGKKKFRLPCYDNPDQENISDCIQLFYLTGGSTLQLGKHSQIGFYSQLIQVAVRHSDYNEARQAAFSSLEYLNTQKCSISGITYDTRDSIPEYLGKDDTGAFVWAFNIFTKGRN
jgi:hypothetical protein